MKLKKKIKNKIDIYILYPAIQLVLQVIKYLILIIFFPFLLFIMLLTENWQKCITDIKILFKLRKIDF